MDRADLKTNIIKFIEKYTATSGENHLHAINEKAWAAPLVGFASGADPLFEKYRKMIGDFYWTPADVMKQVYPDISFDPAGLTVVCWVLPQTDETVEEQRKATLLPSRRWIFSRLHGENFNNQLREDIEKFFRECGIKSASPSIAEGWGYRQSASAGICSNWSERHAAYAAGLGTFSLSDGFITEAGIAVRIGSVIIQAEIEPDERLYDHHMGNCLFHAKGKCSVCMKRCPAGAITEEGHNKEVCMKYIREITVKYTEKVTGFKVNACGLCQAGVPCERRNPVKSK
ncbi:epoxyqueuosine reductase [Geovibrio thiophilus]|uniref:Epoxyqueuosine reductase n=1 Tax=Geovibrio thiophilus TaxID=139438 RepID=A0A410K0N0_9BACT|nr:epoxyqueuosine reductase [Geovibrio thiophilus]QAR33828.1 epoxyqueuosine reductase [Geovibrio thiophilus]